MGEIDIIENVKNLINEYCLREFGDGANFSDPRNVGLAYTTLTDEEIPIQVCVDIIDMKLKTWIDGTDCESKEPDEIRDITLSELEYLDFDDLISGWETYIEDNMEKYRC